MQRLTNCSRQIHFTIIFLCWPQLVRICNFTSKINDSFAMSWGSNSPSKCLCRHCRDAVSWSGIKVIAVNALKQQLRQRAVVSGAPCCSAVRPLLSLWWAYCRNVKRTDCLNDWLMAVSSNRHCLFVHCSQLSLGSGCTFAFNSISGQLVVSLNVFFRFVLHTYSFIVLF